MKKVKKLVKTEAKVAEAKVAEVKQKEEIIEITDKFKIANLEKHGFVVTEIKSEIKGERPKTWILKKGAL